MVVDLNLPEKANFCCKNIMKIFLVNIKILNPNPDGYKKVHRRVAGSHV
jgi:hypothetical protein